MPMLDTVPAEDSPVHLLLIGNSKTGKSTYVADAAIDGFEVIYIDVDNGLSAMRHRISSQPNAAEVFKRVNYFSPAKPVDFMKALLRSTAKKPMVWDPSTNKVLPNRSTPDIQAAVKENPNQPVWIMDVTAIPRTTILSVDSWTSLAADALGVLGPDQNSTLLDGQADQSLYGEARASMLYITNLLQRIHCHVIVQAHATVYEMYEKPKGSSGKVRQADLKLVDTMEVPVSSSRGHGKEMASRFNHIGWLDISNLGGTEIDFRRSASRVAGGPPNKKAKAEDLRFKDLVGNYQVDTEKRPWYAETTIGEYAAALDSKSKLSK